MCLKTDKAAKQEFPPCPECGTPTEYDMENWPPKRQGREEIVHYICKNGHKFIRKYKLV